MMYCVRCGAHNPDDARFCSKCGAAAVSDEAPAAAPPPAPHAAHGSPHAPVTHGAAHAPVTHGAAHAPPPSPPRPATASGGGASRVVFPAIASGPILDRTTARANTMCGVVAAIAGVVLSLVAISALGPKMLLAAVFYAVIGFAMWKSSRVAAVLGLLMAAFNIYGLMAIANGKPGIGMVVGAALLALAYWSAVRGTLAEHRLAQEQGGTAATVA